jgi:hypothetical protein
LGWILAIDNLLKNLILTLLIVHVAFWLCIASSPKKKGWPTPAASSLFHQNLRKIARFLDMVQVG